MVCYCNCITTHITNTWRGEKIYSGNCPNILVLAIIHGPDSTLQEMIEKELTRNLTRHGCTAFPAHTKYRGLLLTSLPGDSIKSIFTRDSIYSVLTIVLRDKSKEIHDPVAQVLFSLYPFRENDFWMYYSAMNDYHPFYREFKEYTSWFWESNLYNLASGSLVYTIRTASFDPASLEKLVSDYAKILVRNMIRNKVIQPDKFRSR